MSAGEPAIHERTTGFSSASRSPRNVMGAASLIGVPVMRVGTSPCPVKRNTTSWSSPSGIGRKKPVSVLLTASVSPVAIS